MLAVLATFIVAVHAQEEFFDAPDLKMIERTVKEPSSPFYYPRLMEKYKAAENELTLEESRHIYFGYPTQPGYVPTDTSAFNNQLAEVLSKSSFSQSDYNRILEYSDALLQEDPHYGLECQAIGVRTTERATNMKWLVNVKVQTRSLGTGCR